MQKNVIMEIYGIFFAAHDPTELRKPIFLFAADEVLAKMVSTSSFGTHTLPTRSITNFTDYLSSSMITLYAEHAVNSVKLSSFRRRRSTLLTALFCLEGFN